MFKHFLRSKSYFLFSIFYFVQGAIQSYLSNFQKPLLVSSGITLDQIAVLSSVMLLPFSIKIAFGLISDRFALFGDHRKSYMVIGLLIAGLCYGSLAVVDLHRQYGLFFALICLSSFGMAFFDTCADGLAVDIAEENEEGAIQSSMMFGRGVGYILLSLVLGQLATRFGFHAVFWTLAAIIFIVLLFVVFQAPAIHHSADRKLRRPWNLQKVWQEHGTGLVFVCLYAVLYSITSFGIDGITTLFAKVHLGLGEDVLGQMGSLQGLGTIAGALLAGLVVQRLGMRRGALLAVTLISIGGSLIPTMRDLLTVYSVSTMWGIFWAFQETVFLALAMQVSKGEYAATLFAGLMMFSNIGTSMGEWTSATLAGSVGLDSTFFILSMANLLLLPLLIWYFRRARNATSKSAVP